MIKLENSMLCDINSILENFDENLITNKNINKLTNDIMFSNVFDSIKKHELSFESAFYLISHLYQKKANILKDDLFLTKLKTEEVSYEIK